MLPITAADLDRFTPASAKGDPQPPVYFIAPATHAGRARWRRDLMRAGTRYVSNEELRSVLEDAVKILIPEDLRADALAAIDTVNTWSANPTKDVPDSLGSALVRVSELEAVAQRDWPPYADLRADRDFWLDMAQQLAARHFVRNWENLEPACVLRDGILTEASFEAIPRGHLHQVGLRAMELMSPSEEKRKN